ncbi:MAG: DUF4157 domain-containing protein [Spirulina sp. SIO3F2]|nr:DUF4157 domain-containing protein [Spirulina sp. SIO3F2]
MTKKVIAASIRRTALTQKQRDRQRQPDPKSTAYPVSNPPTGAIMDNVTAAPETSATVQAKLTIGEPGDKYEREADAMAAQVVSQINQPGGLEVVAPKAEEPASPTVQRLVTANGGGAANGEFESTLNQTLGKGHRLDSNLQAKLGTAMNADFSGLTIHTDQTADVMCKSIGARAFTTGSDIYFGQGEYQPSTSQGQFLITHEATHSMQQGAADVQCKPMVIQRTGLTDASGFLTGQNTSGAGRSRSSGDHAAADRVVGGTTRPTTKEAAAEVNGPVLDELMNFLQGRSGREGTEHFNYTFEDLVRYSQGEFTSENAEFLRHCKFYKDNYQSMIFIYDNFVDPANAQSEVNVSHSVRQNIMQRITAEQQEAASRGLEMGYGIPGIFDEAQAEIYKLTIQMAMRMDGANASQAETTQEYVDARTGGNKPEKKGVSGFRAIGQIITGSGHGV